jgi:hypothetical protein
MYNPTRIRKDTIKQGTGQEVQVNITTAGTNSLKGSVETL